MAYDESLAQRIRDGFARMSGITEKKLFGGIGFLLNGHLCVGVWKESLIVRLDATEGAAALYEPHVREFDVTGRPMKGWILVDPAGLEEDRSVNEWLQRAFDFVSTLPPKVAGK
ncbi:MAG: TfoX/Sxy family protein [Planctomycetes bacterium]|nr:TfoX/Sxy family protein [Planctomycetota bacterium]